MNMGITDMGFQLPVFINRVIEDFPHQYEYRMLRSEISMSTELSVGYEGQIRSISIEDEAFLEREDWKPIVASGIRRMLEDFTILLGEEVTGKYPFIRIYADKHLQTEPLFGHPDRDIPGWIFPKFNSKGIHIYPDHNAAVAKAVEGVSNMAKNTVRAKKKVVAKKPNIDPSKVKKPLCNLHNVKMEFDAVIQQWVCPTNGCNMVARPKRDEDDKSVQIGKGGLSYRLIAQNGEVTLLLISDDNLALDITKHVDIQEFIDVHHLNKATENEFTLDAVAYPVAARLNVIGGDELKDY